MKLTAPAVLLLILASAWAQPVPTPAPFQPLGQVQQYLQLTDAQLQSILTNNGDYNQFAMTKQSRISQLQSEIATETAKDTLDPMALGVRFAEIETICRELKSQATAYQQQNMTVLTDPQKAKLQVLQDAMKLAPVISDAQSGNLIGSSTYAPLFFTSTSGGTISGSSIGGVFGPVAGCYSPYPTAIVRTGDFTATPPNGTVVPPSRISGSVPPPQMRRTVGERYFTKPGVYTVRWWGETQGGPDHVSSAPRKSVNFTAPKGTSRQGSIRPLQREPFATVRIQHYGSSFAARFDALMVNRRRLRPTIRPVMLHDEPPVNRSNVPIKNPAGVVPVLGKLGRVSGRAVPEHQNRRKSGCQTHHCPIGLPRLGELAPDYVRPSVSIRLRNRAAPALQFRDQILQ